MIKGSLLLFYYHDKETMRLNQDWHIKKLINIKSRKKCEMVRKSEITLDIKDNTNLLYILRKCSVYKNIPLKTEPWVEKLIVIL